MANAGIPSLHPEKLTPVHPSACARVVSDPMRARPPQLPFASSTTAMSSRSAPTQKNDARHKETRHAKIFIRSIVVTSFALTGTSPAAADVTPSAPSTSHSGQNGRGEFFEC